MNKWISTIVLVALAEIQLSSQPVVPTPETLYSDAAEFIYSGDYNDAADVLLTLYKRGFQNANISYLIGECYLNLRGQKTKAIPYLKDATRNISANYKGTSVDEDFAPPKALLYLGIAYRLNYDFDNALKCFDEYLHTLDDSDKDNRRTAEYHIERCNFARELIAAPAVFTSDTFSPGNNPSVSSFNPVTTADESLLFFMDQLKFYDAVMMASLNNLEAADPVNLTPQIRSDGDHYITGLSADGNKLLFTSYDPYLSGEIFASDRTSSGWTPLYKLSNEVNTIFNETHASLSPDGNVLYFTSDRKGGYGGTDIYKSVKNSSGEWGRAANLGPLVNTPYNEETPFVSADGSKLFFSSQGHYNMGGFDVFYCSADQEGNWLPPVNTGYPLNTTDDDVFFFPVSDGFSAYQARFPENSPVSELVHFKVTSYGKPERFMINGKIDVSNEPDFNRSGLTVSFVETGANDTLSVKQLNEDGTFRQKLAAGNYRIDFSDAQKLLLSKQLSIPDYFPHNNLVIHESVEVPTRYPRDTIYIRSILFDYNTSRPSEEYFGDTETIISILQKYPDVAVTLNGYADAIGSEAFNRKLSMKRAVAVKEILEKRMERSMRIITLALGESNPVALNSNSDGSDNPAGRKYNRRVEIHIEGLPDTLHIIHIDEVPESLRVNK